ncbi:MAG TPA: amidase family protein [Dermatophilaceae bacterium]|jgi:amidase|nr:amidase family protein [Dermatophilaceae bacterium]
MTDAQLRATTAVETADAVRSGRHTARYAVERALERIAARDNEIRAFTVVRAEAALAEADALDAGGPGHDGPLAGVPVAVKEEYDVTGHVTTLGGRGNSTPVRADSEVIRRLRAAGAVIVGKTAMPEFGQFPHTESLAHGRTHNPWDLSRSPGGSSGGSAAAVAAGMVPVAMGADGGGSIRIPASCCGLVGLKPSRGRVSVAPLTEHWFALVCLGALTRTAADSALVLDVISGATPTDRWRLAPPGMPFAQAAATPPGRLRVGWTTTPVLPGGKVDPQVVSAVAALADRLAGLGHDVQHISPRWPAPTTAFLPQFYAGMRVEAGQVEHPELLEPRTKATVRLSGWATDRVVARALRAGERVTAALDTMFADWDVLLTPTLPVPPPPLGQLDGQGTLRSQIVSTPLVGFTTIFNVSGHPAASVPAGLTREGWPVGAQLVAGMGQEGRLLALAAQLEAAP